MSEIETGHLEKRVSNIMECIICREVPKPNELYACSWGHFLCETCTLRWLADEALRNKEAHCPICRIPITWQTMTRNIAAMNSIRELPRQCPECFEQCITYASYEEHVEKECQERQVNCKNRRIGCSWSGSFSQSADHEAKCVYPQQKLSNIIKDIEEMREKDKKGYSGLRQTYNLMSYDYIFSHDIQLHAQYSYFNALYFQSNQFTAFQQNWAISVVSNIDDPDFEESQKRKLKYRLQILSNLETNVFLRYYITESTRDELKMKTKIHKFLFTKERYVSQFKDMNLIDNNEVNKILGRKSSWVRLFLFLKY